jgi:hypothetical protein
MWLFAVRGTAQPGTTDEFAQHWHDVYSARFPEIPEFVRASFSTDRATDTWLALAFWSARPDEARLRQAIQELGARIGPLMAGPPTADWYKVLQEI